MQGRHVVSAPSIASAALVAYFLTHYNKQSALKRPIGEVERLRGELRIKMRACVGTKRGSYPRAANPIRS